MSAAAVLVATLALSGASPVQAPLVFVGLDAPVLMMLTPSADGLVEVKLIESGVERTGVLSAETGSNAPHAGGVLLNAPGLGPLTSAPAVDVTARPRVPDARALRLLVPSVVGDVAASGAIFDHRGRVEGLVFRRDRPSGVIDSAGAPVTDLITLRRTEKCGGVPRVWAHKTRPLRAKTGALVMCTNEGGYVARVELVERIRGRVQTRAGVAYAHGPD